MTAPRRPRNVSRRGVRRPVALLAGVVTYLLLVGATATAAYWTAGGAFGGQASSAGIGVTMSSPAGLATTYAVASPAAVVTQVTVGASAANPATVNLSVSSAVTPSTGGSDLATKIRLAFWSPSGGSCGSMPATGGGTLAAPPALPAGAATRGPGQTAVVCMGTQPSASLSSYAGQNVSVVLTLTGALPGTSWTATASAAAFTQTVAAAASFMCTNNGTETQVNITWDNTPTAVGGTIYRARINGVIQSSLNRDFWYRAYSNLDHNGTGLPNVAGFYTFVIEETTSGVTTVAYSGQVEAYYHPGWGRYVIRCA